MALPTNSAGPDAPTDSTDIDGLLGLGLDAQEIRNWLVALSPSGASAYDTGWVTVPLRSGFTNQGGAPMQVRRVGKIVRLRWGITSTGLTAGSGYVPIADVPAGFRPTGVNAVYCSVASSTAQTVGVGSVQLDGSVNLRPNAVLGGYYLFDSFGWVLD